MSTFTNEIKFSILLMKTGKEESLTNKLIFYINNKSKQHLIVEVKHTLTFFNTNQSF